MFFKMTEEERNQVLSMNSPSHQCVPILGADSFYYTHESILLLPRISQAVKEFLSNKPKVSSFERLHVEE